MKNKILVFRINLFKLLRIKTIKEMSQISSQNRDSWFYAGAENQAVGPVPFVELQRLVAEGTIAPDVYVIEENGSEWKSFSDLSAPRMAPTPPPIPPQVKQTQPRRWPTILFLVLFWPVGLFLLWRNNAFSRATKIVVSSIFGLLFLLAAISGNNSPASNSSSPAASSTAAVEQEMISWSKIDSIYNLRSRATDLQKNEAWKNLKGKRVSWTGEVTSVSDGFTGLLLQVKMNPDTLTSDVIISLKHSQREKASRLRKGDAVSFTGKLDSWGSILPISVDDGEISE